jgi:hypothetical protein
VARLLAVDRLTLPDSLDDFYTHFGCLCLAKFLL